MRVLLFLCFISLATSNLNAQDSTLKEYVGNYIFPDGSFVPSAEISLRDTVLNINSEKGTSDLVKRSRDTFSLLNYDGTVYFKRDSTNKISGVKVEVEDVLVEGNKQADNSAVPQKTPASLPKKSSQK
jgi:hypothetical protein